LADNNDRLTIISNGNVGIGTTLPAARLDISAAGTAGVLVQTGGLFLNNRTGFGSLFLYNNGGLNAMVFEDASTTLTRAADALFPPVAGPTGWRYGTSSNVRGGSTLQWQRLVAGQGSIPTIMTLTGEGQLGIGTSNPLHTLDVCGNVRIQGSLIYSLQSI
jgi:hypothetical protein